MAGTVKNKLAKEMESECGLEMRLISRRGPGQASLGGGTEASRG